MSLNDELKKLNSYPFHMPGHKRNEKFKIPGSELDITEIEGFDNLHSAGGILLETENKLKRIYNSKKSFMLVNGSTVGILAAIFALCDEGDRIIIARNCHKSVYNACMLRGLKVNYIEPEYDEENGFYKGINKSLLGDAKAVVITSPTYEGYISEVKTDIPLIVDAAHGAHFGISDFPKYPKGDIVISSLHKTLPALTQSAVLNVYNDEYTSKIKLFLDIFETSSPSYVLMNSVDICCDYVLNHQDDFERYYNELKDFRRLDLERLKILNSDDIGKIVISSAKTSISGTELAEILRKKYSIETEAASKNYIILMTSVADEKSAFEMLKKALTDIDRGIESAEGEAFKKPPCPTGEQVISIESSRKTEIENAAGMRANEFVYAYPPDIPLIVPNEIISGEIIEYIKALINSGVNVLSDSSLLPTHLLTKDDI